MDYLSSCHSDGFFIYLIIKYILESVGGQVKGMHGIIMALDNRVKAMNNDMIKLDLLISHSLNLKQMKMNRKSDGKRRKGVINEN